MAKSIPKRPIKLPFNACLGVARERTEIIKRIDDKIEIYEIIYLSFV